MWFKPRIGLACMPGYFIEMKEKDTYVNSITDVETSRYRHIQLVREDGRLICFQCNLCKMEFPNSDNLIEARKKRHEEWHDSSQSSKHASQNKIWGKVIWKKIVSNDHGEDLR